MSSISSPIRTIVLTTVCALVVVGVAIYVRSDRSSTGTTDSIELSPKNYSVLDGDDDGWRDQFILANTNEKLMDPTLGSGGSESTEPLTLTDQLGMNFFTRYMFLRQSNSAENPQAINELVNQTMEEVMFVAPQAGLYTQKDIVISPISGEDSERAYANTVASILITNMPTNDSATLATEALEKNDPAMLEQVRTVSSSYSKMMTGFLATPVPTTLVNEHLNLINAVGLMRFVSDGMSRVFDDPLQSFVALAEYENALRSMQSSLLGLNNKFLSMGIKFSGEEPATVFSLVR